jgi:hypothetical protein
MSSGLIDQGAEPLHRPYQVKKKAMSPLGVGGPRLKGEDSMQEDLPWTKRRFALG